MMENTNIGHVNNRSLSINQLLNHNFIDDVTPSSQLNLLENFEEFIVEKISDVGEGRSASLDCNDIHSVFAFLAFLFALLNFVINMQGRFGCFEGNYPAQASAEIFSIKNTFRSCNKIPPVYKLFFMRS